MGSCALFLYRRSGPPPMFTYFHVFPMRSASLGTELTARVPASRSQMAFMRGAWTACAHPGSGGLEDGVG